MWDSLNPEWNGDQIVWLKLKKALNSSRIRKKTVSDPVENCESSKVKQGESNQVKHGENNQVIHGG